MSEKIKIYYTVCANFSDAKKLATSILKKKKAICINIFKEVTSLYLEKNKLKNSKEVAMMIKSFLSKKKIYSFINQNHPYKIPFIVEINTQNNNRKYTNWAKGKL